MNSSQLRAEAREKLQGKWKTGVLITLIYTIIFGIISGVEQSAGESSFLAIILSFVTTIIIVPIAYGLIISFFKLYDDSDVSVIDFLKDGFTNSNFKRSWAIGLYSILKLILPILLFLVASIMYIVNSFSLVLYSASSFSVFGLISIILEIVSIVWLVYASYSYSMASYIGINNPELSSKECVQKSKEIMEGNRFKLFVLQLSFIGWSILSIFTLFIGLLWLAPYMNMATIAFYKSITSDNNVTSEPKVIESDDSAIEE